MKKKETYLHPEQTVISLEMMRETLQGGSFNGGGDNLGSPDVMGGDWTDWFLNGMGGLI